MADLDTAIQSAYPKHHEDSLRRRALPTKKQTKELMLFNYNTNQPGLKVGSTHTIIVSEPRDFMLVAQCLGSGGSRFGLMSPGSLTGLIAGIVTPSVRGSKSPRDAIVSLLYSQKSCRAPSRPSLLMKVLIVDTFRLGGPPTPVDVQPETRAMLDMTSFRMPVGAEAPICASVVPGKAV